MCDPCQWHHHRIGRLWCPPGAVGRLLIPFGWQWITPIFIALESFPFLFVHMFLGLLYLFSLCLLCVLPCLPVLCLTWCPCCSLFPLLSLFNLLLFILFSSLSLLCLIGLLVFFCCHHLFVVAGCVLFFWGGRKSHSQNSSRRGCRWAKLTQKRRHAKTTWCKPMRFTCLLDDKANCIHGLWICSFHGCSLMSLLDIVDMCLRIGISAALMKISTFTNHLEMTCF